MTKTKDKPQIDFARSTNLGAQFLVFTAAGFGGGYLIDSSIGWRVPVFAIAFSIFGIVIAFYHILKDTKPKPKDKENQK